MGDKPSLDIQQNEHDGVLLLSLNGQIEAETVQKLQTRLKAALVKSSYRLIIDFSRVSFISSIGIGIFVREGSEATKQGGEIILTALEGDTRYVFEKLGLAVAFKFAPSVEAALKLLK